jgi:transposase
LVKLLWHDGVGMSLYTKRLEAGKFIWPTSGAGEAVQSSAAQLGYLLGGDRLAQSTLDPTPCKGGLIGLIGLICMGFPMPAR